MVERVPPVLLVAAGAALWAMVLSGWGFFVLVGAVTGLGLANPNEKDAYGIKLTRDLGIGHRVRTLAGPHRGGFGDQTGLVSVLEPDQDLLGSTEHQDIDVRLARLHGEAHQVASRMGVLDLIGEDHVHATVAEAVDAAPEMLTHSPDDA